MIARRHADDLLDSRDGGRTFRKASIPSTPSEERERVRVFVCCGKSIGTWCRPQHSRIDLKFHAI